jgi:hypothetical protein
MCTIDELRSTCPPTINVTHHQSREPDLSGKVSNSLFAAMIQLNFNQPQNRLVLPPTFNQLVHEVIMFANGTLTSTYNERQMTLIKYLEDRVKEGKNFFKSKYIARETGLSSKEVGTNMGLLAENCPKFTIQKYSYSNSTTWLITPSQA